MKVMPREWRPSFAGSWYPADPAELQRLTDPYLESSAVDAGADAAHAATEVAGPTVLVLPHAGLAYSVRGQMAAWRRISAERACAFDLVLVIAPTHYDYIPDRVAVGARFDRYRAIPHAFPGASALFGTTETHATVAREHAVELMLPVASQRLGELRGAASRGVPPEEIDLPQLASVVLGAIGSRASAAAVARRIAEDLTATTDPARTLILVSSDFTHYGPRFGYTPFGIAGAAATGADDTVAAVREQDLAIAEAAAARNIERYWELITARPVTVCGRFAIAVALELMEELSRRSGAADDAAAPSTGRVLDYYTSLDTAGGRRRERDFVCYATIGFGVGDG